MKRTHTSVVIICTSGIAETNFYPAVIEATESCVFFLICTDADRFPALHHCHAGQAIDKLKIHGNYPNLQSELSISFSEN